MKTYKAVEVYEPGKLRVVASRNPDRGKCGFAWKVAESVTPTRRQSWEFTLA